MTATLPHEPLIRDHSPGQERALGGYVELTAVYAGAVAGFLAWLRVSGRQLPERVDPGDLALAIVATHKASRLVARERVTSAFRAPFTRFQSDAGGAEVNEAARGRGLRRAVGELLVCPYCLDMWIGTSLVAGLAAAPRATRWIASVFVVQAGADVMQIAYAKAKDTL